MHYIIIEKDVTSIDIVVLKIKNNVCDNFIINKDNKFDLIKYKNKYLSEYTRNSKLITFKTIEDCPNLNDVSFVCMECLEEKTNVNLYTGLGWDLFRCSDCGKLSIVIIDKLIVPTIIELNKKGYETIYCCAGHDNHIFPNTYIMFARRLELILPCGFDTDYKLGYDGVEHTTIRKKYFDDNDLIDPNIENSIIKYNNVLLDWAKSLPNIK